jgi:hypothetical protein
MSKPYVPVVLFYSGLYRLSSLSNNVHLTIDAAYAVNLQSPQSQVILQGTKENGDLWFVKGHLLSWFLLVHTMEGISACCCNSEALTVLALFYPHTTGILIC